MEKRKQVLEIIESREQEAIEHLQRLIRTDTSVIDEGKLGNEGNAQGWIADVFKEMGCKVDVFEPDNEKFKDHIDYTPGHNYEGRPNVAGVIKGAGGGKSLLIDMHIDTVPLGNPDLWTHHPLSGDVEDGKIYGRGACDMKAGHAAAIMAVDAIRSAGIKLKGDLTMISVVDEERGEGNGCVAYIDRGYKADGCLFPEGTSMDQLFYGSQGLLLGKIKLRARSAHALIKWKGINAIEKMMKIIDELNAIEKDWSYTVRHPDMGPPMVSVCRIHGGTEVNCIPEECEIYFNAVYLPIQVDEQGRGSKIRKEIEDRVARVCQGDTWLVDHPAEVIWMNEITPSAIDPDHDLVNTMKRVANKELNQEVRVRMGEMPTMSRIMMDLASMPMITYGPGGIEQAHAIDEHCQIDQYLQAIRIIALFIIEWCGVAEDQS